MFYHSKILSRHFEIATLPSAKLVGERCKIDESLARIQNLQISLILKYIQMIIHKFCNNFHMRKVSQFFRNLTCKKGRNSCLLVVPITHILMGKERQKRLLHVKWKALIKNLLIIENGKKLKCLSNERQKWQYAYHVKGKEKKLQFTNESTMTQHMHNKKPEISSPKSQPIVQC